MTDYVPVKTDDEKIDIESEREEQDALLSAPEGDPVPPNASKRSWLRTAALTALSLVALVAIAALFHPSSPLRKHLPSINPADYYHGNFDGVGTFSDDAQFAPNPLPTDDKFGDVPFAAVGKPLAPPKSNGATSDTARSNGTHLFEKTVIIVSLDGVRPDYLSKAKTPHLLDLGTRGIMAEHLEPIFPSLTFPNHWTLMTGLYPSSHGIVANDFWDPALNKEFVYTDSSKSWDAQWWQGEPIWSTAVKNGLRSGVIMWPGPPKMLDGTRPTYFVPFKNHYSYHKKVDKIAEWLDMPFSQRPHVIAAYAPEVDQEGHKEGPFGVDETLHKMDQFAKEIKQVLAERNLLDIVDVLIVSDHGMADTHNERIVFLDDILGPDGYAGIQTKEGWPSAGLRFKPSINVTDMIARLDTASRSSKGGFDVYTHETMPERWHFTGHERIADVYVVPHVGWAVSNHQEFDVEMQGSFKPLGNHGYDNQDPSMHAIFIGHGPFADKVRQSSMLSSSSRGTSTMPGFSNLEIYDLVTRLLGIPAGMRAPHNGTRGFWDQYLSS